MTNHATQPGPVSQPAVATQGGAGMPPGGCCDWGPIDPRERKAPITIIAYSYDGNRLASIALELRTRYGMWAAASKTESARFVLIIRGSFRSRNVEPLLRAHGITPFSQPKPRPPIPLMLLDGHGRELPAGAEPVFLSFRIGDEELISVLDCKPAESRTDSPATGVTPRTGDPTNGPATDSAAATEGVL